MPEFFIVKAADAEGVSKMRRTLHPQHSAHLDTAVSDPKVVVSGPLMDAAGSPVGSFFIFEAKDESAVKDFVSGDPFAKNSVWSSFEVHQFDWRRGNPS